MMIDDFQRILLVSLSLLFSIATATTTTNNITGSSTSIFIMAYSSGGPSFDRRGTLSRNQAKVVYDKFAQQSHYIGGKDVDSGYGGPAITALLEMAELDKASNVLDYGCGQGKLVQLVSTSLQSQDNDRSKSLSWRGIDQSPVMIKRYLERNCNNKNDDSNAKLHCTGELLESGNPDDVQIDQPNSYDRFISTYCLDLLSEEDMYKVLDLAERSLDPTNGKLLLAGITWGYTSSFQTFVMTLVWEILYKFYRTKVGGCRPQKLQPYLEAKGFQIEKVVYTLPRGYPWMCSEVILARPPLSSKKKER